MFFSSTLLFSFFVFFKNASENIDFENQIFFSSIFNSENNFEVQESFFDAKNRFEKSFEFFARLNFEHDKMFFDLSFFVYFFRVITVFRGINIYSKKKLIRKFDSNFEIFEFVRKKIVSFFVFLTRKS